jgi:hypothetical protein
LKPHEARAGEKAQRSAGPLTFIAATLEPLDPGRRWALRKLRTHLVGMRQAIRTWARLKKEPKTPTLGPQPTFVLASLGFVMRSFNDHVVQEPLPGELQSLVEQLPALIG